MLTEHSGQIPAHKVFGLCFAPHYFSNAHFVGSVTGKMACALVDAARLLAFQVMAF